VVPARERLWPRLPDGKRHDGYCLIVTGSDPPVWLTGGDACTTALTSVADWTPRGGTWPVEEGTITNNHTGWYLDWDVDAGGTILQEPYNIPGIFWTTIPAS
jgi:hypothetical protein